MLTRREALSKLRKRFPGQKIKPTEKQSAPGPEERRDLKQRREALWQERHRRDKTDSWSVLLTAAECVCDVDGDPPSIDELRKAVEAVNHDIWLRDELAYIDEQLGIGNIRCCVEVGSMNFGADTWEEVVEIAVSWNENDLRRPERLKRYLSSALRGL